MIAKGIKMLKSILLSIILLSSTNAHSIGGIIVLHSTGMNSMNASAESSRKNSSDRSKRVLEDKAQKKAQKPIK